jgi:molybdate transport system substrate-binding protein
MTKLTRLLVGALALTLSVLPQARAQDASPAVDATAATKPVVVFAAASLKNALDRIAKDWDAKSGGKATISFAASSALAKQVESGAPADIFISADLKWMDYLAERKLIADATRKNLLGNTLVLIAPADSPASIKIAKGFDLAGALGDGRIAMGEVSSVPAGIYGKAALTSLGVWDSVSAKVAGAENVRAALTYVARGEAPLGIVYSTDAKSEPKVKVLDTFPAGSHQPIVYPVALTATSANPAAKTLLEFLSSADAAKVFEDEGFTVLK